MYAPLALSVHSFIDKVGSDAGFASIIGLAILVLLFFSQARETRTLRDIADQAEERINQLEAQVARLVRGQAAGAGSEDVEPTPAEVAETAAARSAAPAPAFVAAPATAVLLPAAPAGTAAPALAAATRLIPMPTAAAAAPEAPAPVPSVAPVATPHVAPVPAPATVAGSNGSGHVATPPPPPAFSQPPPRVQLRPGGAADTGRRTAPPVRGHTGGRSRLRSGLILAGAAVAIAAVVAVLLVVTSNSGNQKTKSDTPTTNAPSGAHRHKGPPFKPSTVTVTVLNGTATSGAAAKISGQLGGAGYTEGLTTNANNQLHTTSTVGYMPGNREAALHVAKALGLNKTTVGPVDASAKSIACPPSTASCTADVVVTVGADLANQ